jgi:hypothetical protein
VTRIDLGLVAIDSVFLVVGYSLLYALGLVRLRVGDLRLVGLSYLAGWALVGSVLSLALMVGIGSGVVTTLVLSALLIGGCAIAGKRVAVTPDTPPTVEHGSRHPLAVLAVGLGAAILVVDGAAAILASLKSVWTTDLDVVTAWLPRAAVIYQTHQFDPGLWGTFLAAWYPPLAPTMYAGTFDFVGGFHPSVLPVQQVTLGIAFVLAALGLLDRFVPRWISFPTFALLFTTPWFWWRLQSLLPDQTLAYLIVTGALVCVIWLHERRGAWLGLAVVFLAAATLTKVEGLMFVSILVVVILAAGLFRYRRAAFPACVLLLGPAAILPWYLWLARHRVPTSTPEYNTSSLLSPSFLFDHVDRLTYALHVMVRSGLVFGGPTFAIIWLSIGVALAVARRIPAISAAVAAWLTLSFLGLGAIYWVSRLEVTSYVAVTVFRVGTTIVIGAAAITPLLLGLALRGSPAPVSGARPPDPPAQARSDE